MRLTDELMGSTVLLRKKSELLKADWKVRIFHKVYERFFMLPCVIRILRRYLMAIKRKLRGKNVLSLL